MAVTRLRNDKQLGKSTTAQSIMISDASNEASWFAPVDGAPRILYYNSTSDALTWLTMGTNISINETTNELNASAGAGGYSEIQDEGNTVGSGNTKINFVGTGVTAANAGAGVTSVTLNSFLNTLATSGSVNLTSHVSGDLPFGNIAQITGPAVLGRAANSLGDLAAITANNDHEVLRRSGTSIGFGAINLAQSNAVTGVLDETNGGTGLSSYTLGDTIYASAANTLAKLPGNTTTTKQFLSQTGTGAASAAPAWATLSSADLSDGANLAHINATETISALWTFSTLPQSSQVPSTGNDLTNKTYVDSLVANQRKLSVRAATTANITLSGTQTIDSVAVVAGDRVLVKNQSSQAQNGIYVVAAGAWSRAADMDAASEVDGTFVVVEDGGQEGTLWLTVSEVTNLGTDTIVFTQVNKATDLVAGDGLIPSGLTWHVDLATNSGLEFTTAQLRIKSDTVTANTAGITLTANGAGVLHDPNTLSSTSETLAVKTQMSITSDASGIKLSGDATTPGNSKYYGTNGAGTKGFYDLPTGSITGSGVANQVTFWTGTSSIGGDTGLTYNSTTNELSIADSGGSNHLFFGLGAISSSGTINIYNSVGDISVDATSSLVVNSSADQSATLIIGGAAVTAINKAPAVQIIEGINPGAASSTNWAALHITGTINQTNHSGTAHGIFVGHTLTAISDYIGLEVNVNNSSAYAILQTGPNGNNVLEGNLAVGANAFATEKLTVTGNVSISDTTNGNAAAILGRTATTNIITEVTLGAGLSLSSGTLSTTAVTIAYIENQSFSSTDLSANTGVVKDRNGNNIAFTVPTNVDEMEVYRNGLLLTRGGTGDTRDYSVTTNTITFVEAITTADRVIIKKFS